MGRCSVKNSRTEYKREFSLSFQIAVAEFYDKLNSTLKGGDRF